MYSSMNWVIIGSDNGMSLFDAKPLPEPMLAYCQLDTWERISLKFELIFIFIFIQETAIEYVVCQNSRQFIQG